MSEDNQVKTLEKSISLLTCLAESKTPLALKELTERTELKTTTCYRLLKAMKTLNLVDRGPGSKKYRLGPKIVSLGVAALNRLDLRKNALPFMTKLREETGETANLSIIDNTEILFIERVQSDHLFNVNLSVGSRLPVYCTSQGKAILAYLPEDELKEIIEKINFNKITDKTHFTPNKLRKELTKIRENGFSVNDEEYAKGLCAVAAPIFNHNAYPIAAVNISYAIARHEETDAINRFSQKVMEASEKISLSMGHLKNE